MNRLEHWIDVHVRAIRTDQREEGVLDGFLRVGSRFAVGAIPIDPANAAARSERISACRLVARMVSRERGLRTIRTVIASTVSLNEHTKVKGS